MNPHTNVRHSFKVAAYKLNNIIIPRALMASESIALASWAIDSEAMRARGAAVGKAWIEDWIGVVHALSR